jgi:hypothetical protein
MALWWNKICNRFTPQGDGVLLAALHTPQQLR